MESPSKANGATPISQVNATAVLDDFSYLAIPDTVLEAVLTNLPKSVVNNYDEWWRFTCMMKHVDKYDLWQKVSQQSTRFNKANNDRIWKGITLTTLLVPTSACSAW
eukprot:m.360103 g.360103  ORF g.360103 m.360103 type:complete len:107 (-) comp16635_c0_seq3:767-1087(-)